MASTTELAALIHQLRGASKLQRLKLLALAWRQLRALSAYDLKVLAREAGIEGLERLLEELRDREGINPAALLRAIEQAVNADPSALRALLHDVSSAHSDPERVTEAKALAERWLAEAVGPFEPVPEPVSLPRPDDRIEPEPSVRGPVPRSLPDAEGQSDPQPQPPAAAKLAAPEVALPAASESVTAVSAGASVAQAREVREPEPRRPARLVQRGRGERFAEQLREAMTARQRLQVVRAWTGRPHALAEEDLAAALRVLPSGWVRRRALVAVLAAGVPADLDAACGLIEQVAESPTTRLWAYTELVQRASTGLLAANAVLAANLPASVRRRLRNRLHLRAG